LNVPAEVIEQSGYSKEQGLPWKKHRTMGPTAG
jgi:hypothetical protein